MVHVLTVSFWDSRVLCWRRRQGLLNTLKSLLCTTQWLCPTCWLWHVDFPWTQNSLMGLFRLLYKVNVRVNRLALVFLIKIIYKWKLLMDEGKQVIQKWSLGYTLHRTNSLFSVFWWHKGANGQQSRFSRPVKIFLYKLSRLNYTGVYSLSFTVK